MDNYQTRYALELRPLPNSDIPAAIRLRRLLKYALRVCDLNCEDYFPLQLGETIRSRKKAIPNRNCEEGCDE